MSTDNADGDTARLVVGVSTAFLVALLLAWPFAYLSAIATCILLAARSQIKLTACLFVTLIVGFTTCAFYYLFHWFGQYAWGSLLLLFTLCYAIYYRAARGGSKIITLAALLSLLLISTSHQYSVELARLLTVWLPVNVFLGFLFALFALQLFPLSLQTVAEEPILTAATARDRSVELSIGTCLFISICWLVESSDVLTMVFLSLFCHRLIIAPQLRFKVIIGYFLANLLGGAVALVAFESLIVANNPIMLFLLSITSFTLLSWSAFASEQGSAMALASMNSFIALLGASFLYQVDYSELAYFDRLRQIAAVGVYLLCFFSLYKTFAAKLQAGASG